MNHQPYETWLLSDEALLPEQAQALQEHLQTCPACQRLERSWSGVEQLFRRTGLAAPAAGFPARWQARLAEAQRQRQQRNTWIMLAVTGGAAVILLLLLGGYALDLFRSPEQLLIYGVYRLTALYFYARASLEFLPVLRSWVGVFPLAAWTLTLGLVSILGVLWIVAYQKIMVGWRIRT